MKKIYKIITILLIVIVITGCTSKKPKEEEEEKELLKYSVTIFDEAHEYFTTLNYEGEDELFTIKKQKLSIDDDGFQHNLIESRSMSINLEAYHSEGKVGTLDELKKKYENTEGYKEYTWNNYPGFLYNANENEASFALIVEGYDIYASDEDEEEKYNENGDPILHIETENIEKEVLLFGKITCMEGKKCNALSSFRRKEFQTLLRTFERGKLTND